MRWKVLMSIALVFCFVVPTCGAVVYRYGPGSVGKALIFEAARVGVISGKTAAEWCRKVGVEFAE